MSVRPAAPDDLVSVMRLLDGAVLDVDVDEVRGRITDEEVLVSPDEGSVSGAIVLDGGHISAIAVRRERQDRGIGRQLVEAARTRSARLTAEFDADVRAFYESLGFEIQPIEGEPDRYRGVLE